MSNPVMKLIDFSQNENINVPVSYNEGSVQSNFNDDVWDFSPHIENRNCKRSDKEIDFRIKLKERLLTSHVYESLLNSLKGFLYARLSRPHPRTGKVVKPRTLVGIWFRFRPLLTWMADNNIYSFELLTPTVANEYRRHVKSSGLKPNTVLKRLSVLEMLHAFSDYYPNSLKENPWPEESSVSISGDRKNHQVKQTSEMPEKVFTQLGRKALKLVEQDGELIVDALDECHAVIERYREKAIEKLLSGKSRPVVREWEFQIEYLGIRAMKRQLTKIALKHNFENYGDINNSIRELQTACYIVCALFSGMRDSELASLEIGAFFSRTAIDGHHATWLQGTTYKLEEQPTKAEWLVPQCVGTAVSILERLTVYNRRSMNRQIERLEAGGENQTNQHLHELKSWRNSLFLIKGNRGYTYRSMDNETVNNRLQKFVNKHNIRDSNGQLWPIASHQFRRTFAVFVAKNIMGDLRYLRHHFKHWSMDMTLHYARHKRSDDSLFSEVMSERDKLNRIIVSDWLLGDNNLAGGRGEAITIFKTRNSVKVAKDLTGAVSSLADGLFIRATGHSWCLANAESCGGQGLYDSLQCVSCDNAVIDHSLVPVWQGIRDQQADILALDDIGEPVKHHARKTINEANMIIESLTNEC